MLKKQIQRLITQQGMFKQLARASFSSQAPAPVQEEHSKHRMKLPLYDLEPRTE